MTQKLEIFVIAVISLTFAFLAGVKYADSVKESIGWVFETQEGDVELPDLSKESMIDSTQDQEVILQDEIDHQYRQQKKITSQPTQTIQSGNAATGNSIEIGEENNDQSNNNHDEIAN